jgi:hypothetical protein
MVDLTEALGAGQEWSEERCRTFFAQYPEGFSSIVVGRGLYMCTSAQKGAAMWRRLAFADELVDMSEAVNRAVAAAQGAAQAAQNATQAAQSAAQAAGSAQAAAQQALDEAHRIVEEGLIVTDPVSYTRVPVQQALRNMYYEMFVKPGGLTVDEYDALGLTVDEYDALGLTTTQYETQGKKLLGGNDT